MSSIQGSFIALAKMPSEHTHLEAVCAQYDWSVRSVAWQDAERERLELTIELHPQVDDLSGHIPTPSDSEFFSEAPSSTMGVHQLRLRASGVLLSQLRMGEWGQSVGRLSIHKGRGDPLLAVLEPAATLRIHTPVPYPEIFFLGFYSLVQKLNAGSSASDMLIDFSDPVSWMESLQRVNMKVVEAPLPLVRDARALLENQGVECSVEIDGAPYPGDPLLLRIAEDWVICKHIELCDLAHPTGVSYGGALPH